MNTKYYMAYDVDLKRLAPHVKKKNVLVSLLTGNKTVIEKEPRKRKVCFSCGVSCHGYQCRACHESNKHNKESKRGRK